MKNKELVTLLQSLDEDLDIALTTRDGKWEDRVPVNEVKIVPFSAVTDSLELGEDFILLKYDPKTLKERG
jgi:hypothetical protein